MRAQFTLRERIGFTLIELLIVVAIIAILAAIAVPNFLEAQTRSKVSRTKADIRTQAVALEAYFVDHNGFTRDSDSSLDVAGANNTLPYEEKANGAVQLTTPVAYMTGLLSDPFGVGGTVTVAGGAAVGYRIGSGTWSYMAAGREDNQGSFEVLSQVGKRPAFVIIGVGPDQVRTRCAYKAFPFHPAADSKEGPSGPSTSVNSSGQPFCFTEYDPTNGTKSVGDVYRFGGSYNEGRFMLNGAVVGSQAPTGGSVW